MKKLFLWGAGKEGGRIFNILKSQGYEIEAFIDRDMKKFGLMIEKTPIISFEDFLEKFNSPKDIILIATFNETFETEIREKVKTSLFKGKLYNWAEFHMSYEKERLVNKTLKYEINFEDLFNNWLDNLISEVIFWERENANPNGRNHDFHVRHRTVEKEFYCEHLNKEMKETDIILDVGCGICSNYGDLFHGKKGHVLGIDPMAYCYNGMTQIYHCSGRPVKFGMFEFLSLQFPHNYADCIIIDNALDHCIDPFASIVECLNVLKVGGVLSLKHFIDEGCFENGKGLHQWNLNSDNGEFIIWNQKSYINVSQELRPYTEIEIEISDSFNRRLHPYGMIVCNITKKAECNMQQSYERIGIAFDGFMRKLSENGMTLEYLNKMIGNNQYLRSMLGSAFKERKYVL